MNRSAMRHLLALTACCLCVPVWAQCKATPAEPFSDFVAKFAESKPLAMSRTRYPTYTLHHKVDTKHGKEVRTAVRTTLSRAADEAAPTLGQILAQQQLTMAVRTVTPGRATLDVFKPDTDWLLTYHFVARQGCWYLHHIEDHSL